MLLTLIFFTRDDLSMSENKLILDLKNDSRDAYNQLFRFYYPKIAAYVVSLVGDRSVAEDITQDVFLYVWENRKKLSVGKGFHSYLYQASYTRCLDYFRKYQIAEKYNEWVFLEFVDQHKSLLDDDGQTLNDLYSKDFFEQLYLLLDEIPPERKEVFVLSYIKGLSTKKVAEQLNMPKRTVESHIYLALKYLKGRMSTKFFLYSVVILFSEYINTIFIVIIQSVLLFKAG